VAGTVRELEQVVESPPDSPERSPDEYLPMQQLTRRIALEREWTPEIAANIRQIFDGLAPEWHTLGGEVRLAPLRDALTRGGVPSGGTCVEIGSGVGVQTPPLLEHFDLVLSTEFSPEMLAHAPRDLSVLLQADASRLPLRDGSADAVVCVNAYLFPDEYTRLLRPGGAVVFASSSGERTPIYLRPEEVVEAMPGRWSATTALAAWGSWTVALPDAPA
jgi:SAM-dependent methyltransferase